MRLPVTTWFFMQDTAEVRYFIMVFHTLQAKYNLFKIYLFKDKVISKSVGDLLNQLYGK